MARKPSYYERKRAMDALNQLQPHAPSWVKIVRDYITKLEKSCPS